MIFSKTFEIVQNVKFLSANLYNSKNVKMLSFETPNMLFNILFNLVFFFLHYCLHYFKRQYGQKIVLRFLRCFNPFDLVKLEQKRPKTDWSKNRLAFPWFCEQLQSNSKFIPVGVVPSSELRFNNRNNFTFVLDQ